MAEKQCNRCRRSLPLANFGKNKNSPDNYMYTCRECINTAKRRRYAANRQRELTQRAKWYRENTQLCCDVSRKHILKKKYGMTPDSYAEMLAKQDGVCAICKQPPNKRRLAVDHNHTTGEVRGLLCPACNRGLGCYKDDTTLFKAAIAYLENVES